MKQGWNVTVPGLGVYRVWGTEPQVQARFAIIYPTPTVTPATQEDMAGHEYTDLEEME